MKADLIITNHSFLLLDIVSQQSILPPSDMMIIDEVHHFEKVAGKHLGSKFDYASTRFLLQQMGVREQKQLAYKIEKMLEQTSSMVEGKNLSMELNRQMSELLFEMDDLFKIIALYAEKNTKNKNHNRISCSLNSYKKNESTLLKAGLERFLFLFSRLYKNIHFML